MANLRVSLTGLPEAQGAGQTFPRVSGGQCSNRQTEGRLPLPGEVAIAQSTEGPQRTKNPEEPGLTPSAEAGTPVFSCPPRCSWPWALPTQTEFRQLSWGSNLQMQALGLPASAITQADPSRYRLSPQLHTPCRFCCSGEPRLTPLRGTPRSRPVQSHSHVRHAENPARGTSSGRGPSLLPQRPEQRQMQTPAYLGQAPDSASLLPSEGAADEKQQPATARPELGRPHQTEGTTGSHSKGQAASAP